MGLLDRIGAFERYKVSPTQGTSGLLTGAQQPMSPFAQQAARSIGGALGMDMRTGQEKLTQALAQIDPNSPDAEAQQLAALVKFGTPAQKVQATQRLTALREKKEATSKANRIEEGTAAIQDVLLTVDKDSFYTPNTLDTVATLQQEYGITPSQLDSIYDSATTVRGITKPSSTAGEARFFSRGKVRDSQTKEEYFVTEAVYKDGRTELIYKNSKGETVTPKGKVATISGTTGQSGAEKDAADMARDEFKVNLERETLKIQQQFNIDEKEAGLWLEEVAEARTKIRKIAPQLSKAYKQQEILTTIKTGGIVPATYKAVLSFLGVEAPGIINAEIFNKLAKEQMIGVLGNFGSNPTEGERASAQELVASINDLTEVNAQTIEAYIKELQYSYDDYSRVLKEGATPQSVADARLRDIQAIIDGAKRGSSDLPDPADVQDGEYYTQNKE
jgi:hypothetical protein